MRCTRDKIPKGDFVLRCGVLDRLVENKMYYKFFEYGNRLKEQKHIEDEREKNKYADRTLDDMKMNDLMTSNTANLRNARTLGGISLDDDEAEEERPDSEQQSRGGSRSAKRTNNVWDSEGEEGSEDDDEKAGKGVRWGAEVVQIDRPDKLPMNGSMIGT